tara:strand:+ start:46 stop:210 length:165 start_codon:yes stop_codon:yes gene_type:complete
MKRKQNYMTYFQEIKRQNSEYLVFRYCRWKKDIAGEKLTKEEQDFLDEYLKLNY